MKHAFNNARLFVISALVFAIGVTLIASIKPLWLVEVLTWMLTIPSVFIWVGLILLLFFIALQRIKQADLAAPVLLVNPQVEQSESPHLLQQLSDLFTPGNEAKLHAHVKALFLKQYCRQYQINSRDGLKQLSQDKKISCELRRALLFQVKPSWRQTVSFGHWPLSNRAYLPYALTILAALTTLSDLP
ncbi:hypothetical protein [Motilimonas sp. KMU-193]|uniref:hypothetical protein n=1 Tax=Motilimonas sp. KMU-193 TaxID=3388668 RepID=UPI00396AF8C1